MFTVIFSLLAVLVCTVLAAAVGPMPINRVARDEAGFSVESATQEVTTMPGSHVFIIDNVRSVNQ